MQEKKLSVVAHVVNDDDYGNGLSNARLHWWIEHEGKKVISGENEFPFVPYYGTDKLPLTINIPQNLPTGDYLLKERFIPKTKRCHITKANYLLPERIGTTRLIQKQQFLYMTLPRNNKH